MCVHWPFAALACSPSSQFTPLVFSLRWKVQVNPPSSSLFQVIIPPVTPGAGMGGTSASPEGKTVLSEVALVVYRTNNPLPQPQKATAELPGFFFSLGNVSHPSP